MKKKPQKETEKPAPPGSGPGEEETTPAPVDAQDATKPVTPGGGGEAVPAEEADASGVPAALMGELPTVQRHAVDAFKKEQQEKEAQGPVDADGVVFDPTVHKTTESGEPIKTTKGRWAKKPGRKSGGASSAPTRSRLGGVPSAHGAATAETSQAVETPESAKIEASAKMAAATFLGVCHGIGGDEWKPESHEREAMDAAFIAYFKAQEISEFPPSLGLGIAIAGYAAPRFARPKTQTRFRAFVEGLKARYQSWKAARIKKDSENALRDE